MKDGDKGKNGYVALFKGRRLEIHADTLYQAKQRAIKAFWATKRQESEVHVILAEVEGKEVVHAADF